MTTKVHKYTCLFCLLFFLLPGCTLIKQKEKTAFTPQRLELLLSANEYQAALLYIAGSGVDDIEKTARKQQVLSLINQYEAGISHEVNNQLEVDNIPAALTAIESGLKKIPNSATLKHLKDKLRESRKAKKETTQRNLLLSQANFLLEQVELFGEEAKLSKPSLNTKWQIAKMEHTLAALHTNLLKCGRKALASANFDIATTCLQMARKINDSNEVSSLIANIPLRTPDKNPVIAKSYKQIAGKIDVQDPLLSLAEIKDDINKGRLSAATKKLGLLQARGWNSADLGALRDDLTRQKNTTSAELLEKGLGLYTSGKISQARQVWLRILSYDSDNNQARSHINRADKVLSRLCELQKAQDEQNSPPGR